MKSEELIEEKERLMAKRKDKEQRLNVLEQQIKVQEHTSPIKLILAIGIVKQIARNGDRAGLTFKMNILNKMAGKLENIIHSFNQS